MTGLLESLSGEEWRLLRKAAPGADLAARLMPAALSGRRDFAGGVALREWSR